MVKRSKIDCLYMCISEMLVHRFISSYLQCEGKCAGRCKNTALLTCPTVPFKDIALPDYPTVNENGVFSKNLPIILTGCTRVLSFYYHIPVGESEMPHAICRNNCELNEILLLRYESSA